MCASWDHVLMDGEKALLYDYLKITWKGAYAMSILVGKIRNSKDGIKAFQQAVAQYAGENRWEEIRDEAENLLQTTFYNGTGKYSLDTHATFQKRQFSKLESCAACEAVAPVFWIGHHSSSDAEKLGSFAVV